MMGAFTKPFGSCGGFIAAPKEIIQYLKYTCPAHLYATSMSPPAVQQVISAIKVFLEKMDLIEVVVVTIALPARPLLFARAHICNSASHTRKDLIKALEVISKVGDLVG